MFNFEHRLVSLHICSIIILLHFCSIVKYFYKFVVNFLNLLYNIAMKINFKNIEKKKGIPDIECELTESDCARAFGLSLKRLRKVNNLTLDKLSEEIEITNPTLNRYESGYNLPSIYMALKISNYFDVNIETIIFAGLMEMKDISDGTIKDDNKYIEQFVGVNKKINQLLSNKTKITFQDHKKKKR